MTAVPAGLSWQLDEQDCRGSCATRTVVAAVTAGLMVAVPGGQSWQLYQQDCNISCTSSTVVAAVPAGQSGQLYQLGS
jgi:hypothetical protein